MDIKEIKIIYMDNYILVTSIILSYNEEGLEKRLLERAKTSGRIDDKKHRIKKRFKIHLE